jgi:hypothetical protein
MVSQTSLTNYLTFSVNCAISAIPNLVLDRIRVLLFLFGKGSGGIEECGGYSLVLGETYVCI